MIVSFWVLLAALYIAFVLWYYNWSGPIKAHEIEDLINTVRETQGSLHTSIDVLVEFMKNDDGKEFVMQNLIRVKKGEIDNPVTGEKTHAAALLQKYSGPFMKALFFRGGHPVSISRKVGGYIDSWGKYPDNDYADEGWHIASMMRYRSRRDLIELVTDPKFDNIHIYKTTAIEKTISFPVQIQMSFFMRPGAYAPLGLLFVGMLIQLVALSI
ncbi:MAG: hypothetical protein P8H32_09060 [Oceanicoccus sp.]|uniref:hypothetical protein n=1 Tax=Oceanicoccus sp. TaxID=2691044 RepID=UPI0026245679|nr:hypothetical protein [Oceanicoccus sp.]MDG1773566.1 hypothetical protein [Oceanicoccus sp.]